MEKQYELNFPFLSSSTRFVNYVDVEHTRLMKTVYTAARSGYGNSKDRSHTYGELSTEGAFHCCLNASGRHHLQPLAESPILTC